MKITTIKKISQKDGSTTKFIIEEELNDQDRYKLNERLETIGYYDRNIFQKFIRFVGGR